MTGTCRICKSPTKEYNLLNYCSSAKCEAVHWDKSAVLKKAKLLRENIEVKKLFLMEAKVPLENLSGHFVYRLRLRGKLNSVYVGMTGLHPHHRYLNHIIGYKASSRAKKFATAMIGFEGPMQYDLAVKREANLASELRDLNFDVHGGH